MNILLLGNTSDYHSGCKAVIQVIESQLADHHIKSFPPMHNYPLIEWDDVDWVICNGEGTMHNNRPAANGTLKLIEQAQLCGKPTAIINSVWQNMDPYWITLIKNLRYFSVRENLSAEHAQTIHERLPDVLPDLSYFAPVEIKPCDNTEVVGQFFDMDSPQWAQTNINIFEQGWNQIVNVLADAHYLYTGRHHELYASCVAKTPFVPHHANSHKLQGIFYSAGASMPILTQPISRIECSEFILKYKDQYPIIFDWMDSFSPVSINTLLAQS